MNLKSRDDLIKEGRPYIIYFRGSDEQNMQVFLSEWACKVRIEELQKMGYMVTRMQ